MAHKKVWIYKQIIRDSLQIMKIKQIIASSMLFSILSVIFFQFPWNRSPDFNSFCVDADQPLAQGWSMFHCDSIHFYGLIDNVYLNELRFFYYSQFIDLNRIPFLEYI